MNGEVNTQNVRQCAPKGHPPTEMIFGLYFFERNVDGIAYLRMFNEFVFPQLAEHFNNQHWEGRFRGLWWAQDGAPAHRLIAVRDRLNDVFGNNRVIGLGHDVEWPPRSPDITPCDFFCGGTLKIRYFQPPRDIDDLRQKVIREFNALYEISQPSFHGWCVICIGEQCFVLQEKGGTWKVKAPDFCVSN